MTNDRGPLLNLKVLADPLDVAHHVGRPDKSIIVRAFGYLTEACSPQMKINNSVAVYVYKIKRLRISYNHLSWPAGCKQNGWLSWVLRCLILYKVVKPKHLVFLRI